MLIYIHAQCEVLQNVNVLCFANMLSLVSKCRKVLILKMNQFINILLDFPQFLCKINEYHIINLSSSV